MLLGFFLFINIYTLYKKHYNHQVSIYMLWYTWEQKIIHIKYKKQPKNNGKIKIIKSKQRKKKKKNVNFECNISVKAMTSREHQESSAINLLLWIKEFTAASNILVLLILSRSSLPYKRIAVSWSLLKSKILGTILLTVFKRVFFSCK